MYKVLCGLFLFTLFSFQPPATTIRLAPQPISFTPKEFHIAVITDQRTEKGAVARLALLLNQAPQPVDLEGGAVNSFRTFINQNLKQNRSLRPIAIRIRECRVTETAAGNRVTGNMALAVAFELLGKDDAGNETSTRLTEYRSTAKYVRPLGQTDVIGTSIRQALVASLTTLNTYMNREAGQNEKLAKGLTVTFTDDTRITDDDTVYYNPDRKLTWADFRALPRPGSRYAAEVFTSFAYEGKSSVKNGIINVNLFIKAYMLKNSSWGRTEAKNAYSLNHEQRHFDITKIITERFKRKIQPDSLTLEDYNSIIQYQFIESYRELNRLQELYDGETNHGVNQAAQERWNQRIDTELRSFGLKK